VHEGQAKSAVLSRQRRQGGARELKEIKVRPADVGAWKDRAFAGKSRVERLEGKSSSYLRPRRARQLAPRSPPSAALGGHVAAQAAPAQGEWPSGEVHHPPLETTRKWRVSCQPAGGPVRGSAAWLWKCAPEAQNNHEGGERLVSAVRKDAKASLGDQDSYSRCGVEPQNQIALLILLREGHILCMAVALGNEVFTAPGDKRRAEQLLRLLASKKHTGCHERTGPTRRVHAQHSHRVAAASGEKPSPEDGKKRGTMSRRN
jgi:hypothetical protein